MLLHTLNLKIGLFQSKNKKLSEMLEISKRFKLTCLLRLQTKANQSIFQIFLNLHSRRNQQFFLVHHIGNMLTNFLELENEILNDVQTYKFIKHEIFIFYEAGL